MRVRSVSLCLSFAFACAAPSLAQSPGTAPQPTPFSKAEKGTALHAGWAPVQINEQKKPTSYEFVDDQGTVVLHATADGAASLLGFKTSSDLTAAPVMSWRWKIARLIGSADNAVATKEDSPVRIVLEFDGDKSKLS